MGGAFGAAVEVLFENEDLAVDILYRPKGQPAVPVRAIVRAPTATETFVQTRRSADTVTLDVRQAEVPAPASGDEVEVSGKTYIVQGTPLADPQRLVWTLDTRPA